MNNEHSAGIIWARMPGFAPWPARRCAAYEEKLLKDVQPTKLVNPIGVVFLGLKRERAWVVNSNVSPFTQENWKAKYDSRKMKSDRDYRAAVSEAVRITGLKLGSDVADVISNCNKDFENELVNTCEVCKGSSHSGSLDTCAICDVKSIHWHCFRVDDPQVLSKQWICDNCCAAKNLGVGSFYENEEEDDTQNKGNSQMAVDDIPFPSLPSLSSYSESNSQSKPVRGRSSLTNKPSNKGEMDSMAIAVLSAAANRKNSSSSATAATSAKNVSNATNSSRPSHSNASSGVNKTEVPISKNVNEQVANQEAPEPTISKLEADDVDDNCFVCGQAGEVLLCDYPMCRKVYHQVCVLKIFPSPNTLELAHQQIAYNNEWWCPRHFCLDCGAIEELPLPVFNLPLPQVLYQAAFASAASPVNNNGTQQKHHSQSSNATQHTRRRWLSDIPQAALQTCAKCPFSLCRQCDVSCTALAAPLLPSELFYPSSKAQPIDEASRDTNDTKNSDKITTDNKKINPSLFQTVQSSTWVPSSSRKTIPRALSSLLNSNSDKHTEANNASLWTTSSSWSANASRLELCCKFCVLSQCMDGNAHILDSQLDSLFSCNPAETAENNKKPNLRYLTSKIPVSYRQAWQVSRVLETAWVKMTNTRLSLPFLRPLLPLSSRDPARPPSVSLSDTCETLDMMSLLEKIHALRYATIDDYLRDVHTLRSQLTEKLNVATHDSATSSSQLTDTHRSPGYMQKQLLLAFDTMEFAGTAFLRRQEARIFTERHIASTAQAATTLVGPSAMTGNSSTANNNNNNSSNNSNMNHNNNNSRKRRSSAMSAVENNSNNNPSDGGDTNNSTNNQRLSDNDNMEKQRTSLATMLQLLPLCSRLACHVQPVLRPGTLTAVLKALQERVNVAVAQDQTTSIVATYDANFTQQIFETVSSPAAAAASAGSPTGGKQPLVMSRSLAAWTEHVITGDARNKFYDEDSPEEEEKEEEEGNDGKKETTNDQVGTKVGNEAGEYVSASRTLRPKHYLDMPAIASAKNTVKTLLQCEEDDVFEETLPKHPQGFESIQQMMDHDLDVVESMLSMKHSLAREDVTLPFPHENFDLLLSSNTNKVASRTDTAHRGGVSVTSLHPQRQAIYQRHTVQTPVPDDSQVLLNRMKEMTQHLFALQERFSYVEELKRQQYLSGSVCARGGGNNGVISLGEMGLVAELKLANDNLRWKLQQREALLESTTVQVAVLQKQLAEQARQIESLTQQNDSSK